MSDNLFDDEPIERHGSPLGVLLGLSAGTRLSTLVEKGWRKAKRKPVPVALTPEPKPSVEGLIDSLLGLSLPEMRAAMQVLEPEPAPIELSTVTPPAEDTRLDDALSILDNIANAVCFEEEPDPRLDALAKSVEALGEKIAEDRRRPVVVERTIVRDPVTKLATKTIERHVPEGA